MNLLIILVVLFASLALLVKLLEGNAKPMSNETAAKLQKWVFIAVGVLLVLQLFRHL